MEISKYEDGRSLGAAAAAYGGARIAEALERRGAAAVILATGASQFRTLEALTALDLDWKRVQVFHLDEYIGLTAEHPASFRRYLKERFLDRVGPVAAFHGVAGDAPDPLAECRRLGKLIEGTEIDVAFAGIGENGHLAFNDPPADFETMEPYLVVDLDKRCREQQLGEGWFSDLDAVPRRAISMSVQRILASRCLALSVPDLRKAQAVRDAVEGPVTPDCPASALKLHSNCRLFLDGESACLLRDRVCHE